MKGTIDLLILSAALISGCASTAAPPRSAQGETFIGYLTPYRGASAGETFKVTTDAITGPLVQVSRVDEGFRGVVRQKVVDLRIEPDAVVGSLDGQPIDLHIEHRDGRVWVQGLYGGRIAGFFFAETAPEGDAECGKLQPWISASSPDEREPASCDAESVGALALMTSYLDENEALALLAVMLLDSSSVSRSSARPGIARQPWVGNPGGRRAASASIGHH
jgi:hypothetical protein